MFIDGECNCEDWNPDKQTGRYGSCCNEIDIWEGNSVATAYTPHVCSVSGQTRCEGSACGNSSVGLCDKQGCDFNLFRLGNKTFYGHNKSINTTKPFTVITQFITSSGTDSGNLYEIRRIWKQDDKFLSNTTVWIDDKQYQSVTDSYCNAQKQEFKDYNRYEELGGCKVMGDAMDRGMVLSMSILDDPDTYLLWLESNFPANESTSIPGVARGPCNVTTGRQGDLIDHHYDSTVTLSNIRYGEIGSTF